MKDKRNGWFERQQPVITQQGIQNKAPGHYKVAVKKGLETTLRVPMVKRVQKPYGYWTYENTVKELKEVIAELGHFPTHAKLIEINRSDLTRAIFLNGGMNKFRTLLGYESIKKPNGYWTYENTLKELKEVIAKLGHFPIQTELSEINQSDLGYAISQNGGMDKFRTLLGYESLQKPDGYWTHENTLKELKEVIAKLGHFPTEAELKEMGKNKIIFAIKRNGGWNKFRTLLGYEFLKKPNGYWTHENTLKELKEVIAKLGHFPTQVELSEIGRHDLITAITKKDGMDKFRTLLGYEFIQKPDGYWTYEITLKELKEVIAKLGHFPTHTELRETNRIDLIGAITKNGGIDIFRKRLGYPSSLKEFIGMSSYIAHRGIKSEKEVKKLLIQYCQQIHISEPKYNQKLSIGNVIEVVCGGRIGIDTTNTKDLSGWIVRRKYLEKDYHKYLDKLWIVVLSNVYTDEDYLRFNLESPKNVEIMSVWDLIDRLQVDIDEHSRRKIEALETCTLRTKDDLINTLKNRTLVEYT